MKQDLKERQFDRLKAIKERPDLSVGKNHGREMWECLCDCGNTIVVRRDSLLSGHTKSCGCLQKDKARKNGKILGEKSVKHGDSHERLHNIWYLMIYRCSNKECNAYDRYGGRGIDVCDEWKDETTGYDAFKKWSLSHGYSPSLTIDRINNNLGYCPTNCRWATSKEQGNNKRNNRIITYNGQDYTLQQLADKVGLRMKTLHRRLSLGWDLDRAVTTPVRK